MKTIFKIMLFSQLAYIFALLIHFIISIVINFIDSLNSSYVFSNWVLDFMDSFWVILAADLIFTPMILIIGSLIMLARKYFND